jgi:hypothetical protein
MISCHRDGHEQGRIESCYSCCCLMGLMTENDEGRITNDEGSPNWDSISLTQALWLRSSRLLQQLSDHSHSSLFFPAGSQFRDRALHSPGPI